MTSNEFMIGPISDGLRKDLKPFATPEDSFDTLINAYQWRGRVLKRSGYTKLGVLANGTPVMGLKTREGFSLDVQSLIAFDTTDSYLFDGTSFVSLPSIVPVTWSGTDYQFFFTANYANSFWATNSKPGINGFIVTEFTGAAGIGPWTVNITSAGNTFQVSDPVFFVNITGPAALNNLRFGTVTTAGNPFTVTATVGGSFTNGLSSSGLALSTTRPIVGKDGIKFYGDLTIGTSWANYNPPIDPNNVLSGALMIFPYRGYLVFLNTWEGNDVTGSLNYPNRARWTQIGTPYYQEPVPQSPNIFSFDPKAARDDLFGRGGANDAPTNEIIVAAAFIRDILVVYFERSTWRLRFVNNSQNPFVWERVNVELGSDCTFSAIPFDKGLMAIGNRGIVISDSNDTIRFDEKIPDEIFNIAQSENGLERVYGIRTFRTKLNYWAFRSANATSEKFPDQVLVFNYDTKNWSIFTDSFTCFGYYYPTGQGYTWADLTKSWSSYTNISWDSGVSQTGYENIVAGNQQGYVFVLEQTTGENDPSLSVSAIAGASFSSTSNNISDLTWITLSGIAGAVGVDGVSLNDRNYLFHNPDLDHDFFTLTEFKPIDGSLTSTPTSYTYIISYKNLFPGSIQINVGSLVFKDPNVNGVLVEASGLGTGTINYNSGLINLSFNPAIAASQVWIRVVSQDPNQGFTYPVSSAGVYTGGGEIAIISGLDIQTKFFNFFKTDKRARLSKIDFYVDSTTNGQFEVNVLADSSNDKINKPLIDNPQSNIVLTSINQYQVGQGDETIYRLYCDAIAQTIQLQITLNDYQLATNNIARSDIQLLAMIFTMRQGGRLI